LYNNRAYHGSSWKQGSEPAETDDLDFAKTMVEIMTMKNPVGWDVYDSTTGEKI
jgi:hypothetical protein